VSDSIHCQVYTCALYVYYVLVFESIHITRLIQGGSNMTGTDLCVNKPQSVPVIFEPLYIFYLKNQ